MDSIGSPIGAVRPVFRVRLTTALLMTLLSLAGTAHTATAAQRYLNLYAPGDGWTLNSQLRVTATAGDTGPVRMMQIYIDGKVAYTVKSNSIDTTLRLSAGRRRFTVTAKSNAGTFSRTVYVQVVAARYSRFAYAAGSDGTISGYALHGTTGILHNNGYAFSPPGAQRSAAVVVGKFLYRSNGESSSISGYSILSDGSLQELPGSPFFCSSNCRALAANPARNVLYAAESYGEYRVFEINAQTGALNEIARGTSGSGPSWLAVDGYGRYLFAANTEDNTVTRFELNALGIPGVSIQMKTGSKPMGIAIDELRKYVVVANSESDSLSVFSMSTGKPVAGSPFPAGPNPQAVAISPSGSFVYVLNVGDNTISAFRLDFRNGSLRLSGTHAVGELPGSLAVDAQGDRVYVACSGWPMEVWSFEADPTTGDLTRVIERTRTHGPAAALALSTGTARVSEISRFLYVGVMTEGPASGRVLVHRIEADGRLTRTSNAPITTPAGVLSMRLHPSNRFLYAPARTGETMYGGVQVFVVNPSTGSLAPGQWLQEIAPLDPRVMLVDPSGRFAYAPTAGNSEPTLFGWHINQNTGALGGWIWYEYSQTSDWAEIDPTGKFMFLNELNADPFVEALNPETGDVIAGSYYLLPHGFFQQISGTPSGRFAVAISDNHIFSFRVNGSTGEFTQISSIPMTGADPYSFAIDPSGRFIYVLNRASSDISAFAMNRQTGTLSVIGTGTTPTGPSPGAVAVENAGKYLYVANSGSHDISIFKIDSQTGALSPAYPAVPTGVGGKLTSIAILTQVQ